MQSNTRLGIGLMIATTFVFAMQDGISRHLAREYNVMMIVMIRYWFFGLFVMAIAGRQAGSIRAAARTTQPLFQIFRGLLLAAEICVMVLAFVYLGLVESHAVFACYPLLIAALSGPVLGEGVGWRRWVAIAVGFLGVLVILQPGITVFQPAAVIPLIAATMFALYGLLTRYAARRDSAATSFFWTGVSGMVALTLAGVWFWEADDRARLGLDGGALPDRGAGAFPADQDLRGGRGQRRPALCLSAAGLRLGARYRGVR